MKNNLTGIVTSLTVKDQKTHMRILSTQRDSHEITYDLPLPKELTGNMIDYHERSIRGVNYQILRTEQYMDHRSDTRQFITAVGSDNWKANVKYFTMPKIYEAKNMIRIRLRSVE